MRIFFCRVIGFFAVLTGLGLPAASMFLLVPGSVYAFRYELKWEQGHFNLPPGTTEWYVTQGNNMQSILFTSGHHRVRVESKSIIWPRAPVRL